MTLRDPNDFFLVVAVRSSYSEEGKKRTGSGLIASAGESINALANGQDCSSTGMKPTALWSVKLKDLGLELPIGQTGETKVAAILMYNIETTQQSC